MSVDFTELDVPKPDKRPLNPYRCERCGGIQWGYRARLCLGTADAPHEGWLQVVIDAGGVPRVQREDLVVRR